MLLAYTFDVLGCTAAALFGLTVLLLLTAARNAMRRRFNIKVRDEGASRSSSTHYHTGSE